MAKRIRPAISEQSSGPMPWQDFVLGFEVASAALASFYEAPVKPPFVRPVQAPERRDPLRWVAAAMARHFGYDYPHLVNFQLRFWALMQLLDGGFVDEWVAPGDEASPRRLHPALLLAAAEVKLTRNSRFPSRRFAARVSEIIRTELDEPATGDAGAR